MARTDNLTNFLTDVSTAIKEKKGDNTPIKASNFDTEIANLPSGGGDNNCNVYYDETLNSYPFVKNITEIKMIDTSRVTSFQAFFEDFAKMVNFPKIDTSNGTTFFEMFRNCDSMVEPPHIDTSKGTNFSGMFRDCNSLKTIPAINTSNGTNFYEMFAYAQKLETLPLFDTSKGTNFSGMFRDAMNIVNIPAFNTSSGTTFTQMFNNARKINNLPEFDFSSATNISSMFYNCYALVNCEGFKDLGKAYLTTTSANNSNYTLNLSACTGLTEQSLINVLNGLYDIATKGCNTQKCTIGSTNLKKLTSEAGQQALANAQAKGWTVS
jgi:hypothetical protein